MLDAEFIKWISGLGVGGAIAGLIFMVYRKDMTFFANQWNGITQILIKIIQDNTAALASNTAAINRVLERRKEDRDATP